VVHAVIKLHDSSLVTASVAVVGGAEDGNDVFVVRPIVSFHDELMGSRDQAQAVVTVELL
jgi:hypothetical protein